MLKPYLLWGLLLLGSTLSAPVHAQLSKGTRYWGGTVGIQGTVGYDKQEMIKMETRRSGFSTRPEVQIGRFRNATTMLGVGARYTINSGVEKSLTSAYKSNYLNQSIVLLPYFRKYKTLNERWWLFLHSELGVGYEWRSAKRSEYGLSSTRYNYWEYEIGIKPGIVYYFPKKGWAIEGYANILSLRALYTPKSPDQQKFSLSTNAGTAAPSYITLRIARYTNPTSN